MRAEMFALSRRLLISPSTGSLKRELLAKWFTRWEYRIVLFATPGLYDGVTTPTQGQARIRA